jgi:hypothetical protein
MSSVRLDTEKLDALIAAMPERANRIVRSGAFAVQGEAVTRAPFETGYLRSTIMPREISRLEYWVEAGPEYAIYQELGFHHYLSGVFIQNPFMVPAVESVRPRYNAMWKEFFKV